MIKLLLIAVLWAQAWAHDDSKACEARLLSLLTTADVHQTLKRAADWRGEAVKLLRQRAAGVQRRIDLELTTRHALREMSFQTKNSKSGNYDNFVSVPVNGHIVPLLRSDFQSLVQSTAPVMRTLRALLRKIYSGRPLTIRNLGLEELPPAEAKLALRAIKESIYLEPALRHPNMADYPFLTVGGFDGAVVDPKHPRPDFFELNLGTPSGLSNNIQLLRDLETVDPDLYGIFKPLMSEDTTFRLLREALESNASAWTKSHGISVVISPGIYNGAHPDVVMIAKAAGLPLVKSSDLYEDAEGWIRLNTGLFGGDPRVTGIYGRMEESFFLQSSAEQIPLISPNYQDQSELSRRLGLALRPGAIYDYVYDSTGEIVDIKRDDLGRPRLLDVWDTIGLDPARPSSPRGSFAKAIREKRLYYSGLGGRVVDDKRLFRIVTEYLVPPRERHNLARPIRGLSLREFDRFFADPDAFVVKEPNNSGGAGIYFPRALPHIEKEALLSRVRAAPADFEIQYVSTIATLPTTAGGHVPIDLRIFVMMDAGGEVFAGDNSLLVRTGADGGLYTNTSRGGGYGIGVVLAQTQKSGGERPVTSVPDHQAASRQRQVQEGLRLIDEILRNSNEPQAGEALALSFQLREIMDLLPQSQLAVISGLRDYAHEERGPQLSPELQDGLGQIRRVLMELLSHAGPGHPEVPVLLRDLSGHEVTYRYGLDEHWQVDKVEVAEYLSVEDPVVQAAIRELQASGGQLRLMLRRRKSLAYGAVKWHPEPPYFWVNLNPESASYLIPVIGIDLSRPMALASLMHEMEHFRMWREFYEQHRARGLGHEESARAAILESMTAEMRIEGERRAVAAEMRAEMEHPEHPLNQARANSRRAREFYEWGYVNRITYPQFEAVRHHLQEVRWRDVPKNQEFLHSTLEEAVRVAMDNKTKAVDHWLARGDEAMADRFRATTIFDLLIKPYGGERLAHDQTTADFVELLKDVCVALNIPPEECT